VSQLKPRKPRADVDYEAGGDQADRWRQPDLATWLLDCVAEDEQRAKAAQGRSADWRVAPGEIVEDAEHYAHANVPPYEPPNADEIEFIRANGPARVLAECDTKRRIIETYQGAVFTQECHPEYEGNNGYVQALSDVLRLMAVVYKDRPGYVAE
jgi:hypothetical protein